MTLGLVLDEVSWSTPEGFRIEYRKAFGSIVLPGHPGALILHWPMSGRFPPKPALRARKLAPIIRMRAEAPVEAVGGIVEIVSLSYGEALLDEAERDNQPVLPGFRWPSIFEDSIEPTPWLRALLTRIVFETITCATTQERCSFFLQKQILNEMVNIVFRSYESRAARTSTPAEAGRNMRADGDRLRIWTDYLRHNVHRKVNLQELEEFSGDSAAEITRAFKIALQTTPIAFHKRLRLEEARKLIDAEKLSVSAAALAFGYSDAVAFRHAYKAAFGHSPRASGSKG